MKMTRHNGRAGKHGVYNPKHNDRQFDLTNADHIDAVRERQNIYWDCFQGFRTGMDDGQAHDSFEDVERQFYSIFYRESVEAQNERNIQNRHPERNRSTDDLLHDKRTCPEESILQIGNIDESVDGETLVKIACAFFTEMEERFGEHIHFLDWSLHMGEGTPHIHERHVFDCENQYGELCPQQEKALEALGFELPEPDKKLGRHNNRKMVYDAACRALLFDICRKHGLQLEEEPEYGGRKYLEKQDFILAKQKEQLVAQSQTIQEQEAVIQEKEEKLDELTLKLDDVEALIDDVSEIAYDKAVEVVTDTVRVETHKQDIQLVEETKSWLLSPERKAPKKEREYAAARLDNVVSKITKAMQTALSVMKAALTKPEVRKANTQQIKEKARTSIYEMLNRNKAIVAAEDAARKKETHKKQNMER